MPNKDNGNACCTWSSTRYHKDDFPLVFLCMNDNCDQNIIGCLCSDGSCCDETLRELADCEEIRGNWESTGKMLIMRKGFVIEGYKKTGHCVENARTSSCIIHFYKH